MQKTLYGLHRAVFLFFLFCFLSNEAHAIIRYTVEPIIGYERIQKLVPTKHTKDRLIYGARVLFGIPLISGEGEYTRGTDTEEFSSPALTVKDTTDKAKLGLRSTVKLIGVVYAFARAGAQAKQNVHEETLAGVTTKTTEPVIVKPYAGAGLTAKLGRNFRFDADFTVVFADTQNWRDFEYQTTAGIAVEFP